MKVFGLIVAIGAAAFANALPVRAEEAETELDDVECLIMMAAVIDSEKASTKTQGMLGTFYFLGKVVGSGSKLELESRIAEATQILSGKEKDEIDEALFQCAIDMKESSANLNEVGDRVRAKKREG